MLKVKMIILSLLTAFALNAVASTAAWAANEWKVRGAILNGQKELVGGNGPVASLLIHTRIAKKMAFVSCLLVRAPISPTNKIEGKPTEVGTISLKLEYTGCSVISLAGGGASNTPCKISEPLTLSFTGKVANTFTDGELRLGKENELAGTIKIENVGATKCEFAGEYKVTGKEVCLLELPLRELVMHTVNCTQVGSAMEVEKEQARITTSPILEIPRMAVENWSVN